MILWSYLLEASCCLSFNGELCLIMYQMGCRFHKRYLLSFPFSSNQHYILQCDSKLNSHFKSCWARFGLLVLKSNHPQRSCDIQEKYKCLSRKSACSYGKIILFFFKDAGVLLHFGPRLLEIHLRS